MPGNERSSDGRIEHRSPAVRIVSHQQNRRCFRQPGEFLQHAFNRPGGQIAESKAPRKGCLDGVEILAGPQPAFRIVVQDHDLVHARLQAVYDPQGAGRVPGLGHAGNIPPATDHVLGRAVQTAEHDLGPGKQFGTRIQNRLQGDIVRGDHHREILVTHLGLEESSVSRTHHVAFETLGVHVLDIQFGLGRNGLQSFDDPLHDIVGPRESRVVGMNDQDLGLPEITLCRPRPW